LWALAPILAPIDAVRHNRGHGRRALQEEVLMAAVVAPRGGIHLASRRAAALVGLALGALLLAACAPAASPGAQTAPGAAPAGGAGAAETPRPLTRVTMGTPAKSLTNLSIYLAQEAGLFQDEGIDLDLQAVRGDTGVAAVLSGSMEYITQTASPDVLIASINSGDLVAIYNNRDDPLLYLISQPHVADAQGLRGGIIGHGGTRGTHYFAAIAMVKHLGLDPERDVQLISVTDVGQGLAALFAERVTAVTLSPPFDSMALSRGYRRLVVGADVLERFPEGGITTQRTRLRDHRDEAKRLIRAMMRGVYYTLDRPAEAIKLIQREWDLDEATARIAYETVVPALNQDGTVSDAMWDASIKRALQEGQLERPGIRPADYVDWSLVREVQPTLKR
jgi:NitT/TauT family transport system substrate-binding protein